MPFCVKCGKQIELTNKFCEACGLPINEQLYLANSSTNVPNTSSDNVAVEKTQNSSNSHKGADLKYIMALEPAEASSGITKSFQIVRNDNCENCNGSGAQPGTEFQTCNTCKGLGIVQVQTKAATGMNSISKTCPNCSGRGTFIKTPCKQCSGSGRKKNKKELAATIPAGVKTGQTFLLEGEGEQSRDGGPRGNLYIEIKVTFDSKIQPRNSDPNTYFGKEYRGSGFGASLLMKSTRFFEDHIQYGDEIIPYSDLSEITITHMASSMTNGSAETLQKSTNRALSMTFNTYVLGFEKGVDFANKKIAEANGYADYRKYMLRGSDGTNLEVFEDYISISRQGRGISGIVGQTDNKEIIIISNISNLDASNGAQMFITYNENGDVSNSVFPYKSSDADIVNQIMNYINSYVPEPIDCEGDEEVWKCTLGENRTFPILGKELTIDEECDVYNTYRKDYMECAIKYANSLKNYYAKKVHDFDSFILFYIPMYEEYLDRIIKKTTDILVSAGIWTETSETITKRHIDVYHLALDDYTTMLESMLITIQNNKQQMEAFTSLVPNLVGGGFGLSGAVKGIATATAFNLVRDGAASSLVEAINISVTQKAELYGRIRQDVLFERAFLDYWHVYQTLVSILNENDKNVWVPSEDDSVKADNIMKNISNPNFPQEQLPDVMISVIKMNPYKRSIYELLREKKANEDEVNVIKEYFGYTVETPAVVE